MTLVLGPLEDVLSNTEHLSPGNRERLVTVQRHANRLLQMVNKLLDFSSLEGGRMQVKYRPVKIVSRQYSYHSRKVLTAIQFLTIGSNFK